MIDEQQLLSKGQDAIRKGITKEALAELRSQVDEAIAQLIALREQLLSSPTNSTEN